MWQVRVRKPVQKSVLRAPRPERERLTRVLDEVTTDPFSGDVLPLTNQPSAYRRRVGNWRIFFDVDHDQRRVEVTALARRTTTTYKKRQ